MLQTVFNSSVMMRTLNEAIQSAILIKQSRLNLNKMKIQNVCIEVIAPLTKIFTQNIEQKNLSVEINPCIQTQFKGQRNRDLMIDPKIYE